MQIPRVSGPRLKKALFFCFFGSNSVANPGTFRPMISYFHRNSRGNSEVLAKTSIKSIAPVEYFGGQLPSSNVNTVNKSRGG